MKRLGAALGLLIVVSSLMVAVQSRYSPDKYASSLTVDETASPPDSEGHPPVTDYLDGASQSLLDATGQQSPDKRMMDQAGTGNEPQEIEAQAVESNSINADFFLDPSSSNEHFSDLLDEFRAGANVRGAEEREQYQQFFYAQSELISGSVVLDVLECGAAICVAELRSEDPSALRAFIDRRMYWDGFDSKATVIVHVGQPNVTRLVFSHDPEINGITVPSHGG